ncbi:hypothetical protein ACP4OV_020446 [Aristida adscensionis]
MDATTNAAVLARRWRHAFADVHTLSFQQEEAMDPYDLDDSYWSNMDQDRNSDFVALVNAALSCRRRCTGGAAAGEGRDPCLRAFRVAFDSFHHSLAGDVDRWLAVAARGGGAEEIQIDARRLGQPACACGSLRRAWETNDGDGDDAGDFPNPRSWAYHAPRWLYSSGVRTLCLGSCFLDLPAAGAGAVVHLPRVETLTLRWIRDSGDDIQRLVSACPRLADLTLDSCRRVRALAVVGAPRLRRLAVRCCRGARLTVDAPELRALEYRGAVPGDSALSFVGSPPTILSCDIELCGEAPSSSDQAKFADLTRFLERFAGGRRLRLGSSRLGSGIERSDSGFPASPSLGKLELRGALTSSSAIDAVLKILRRAPNLEVLTLLILPDAQEQRCDQPPPVSFDRKAALGVVAGELPVIPCLRDRVREINVVHYQGRVAQRALLRLLLGAAAALEELCVVLPKGKYAVQAMLMGEIESWVINRSVKVMFG